MSLLPKSKNETWIKLYRSIIDWEWYKDPNTKSVFLHLLLTANVSDIRYRGRIIKRGQLVSTLKEISTQTGLSIQQTRTTLNHLQSTQELTIKTYAKYSVITVVNYELYQANQHEVQHSTNKQSTRTPTSNQHELQQTINKQPTHKDPGYIINNKRMKEIKNNNAHVREDENQNQNAPADGSDLLFESGPPVAVPGVGETVYFTNSAGEKVSHVWREKDSARFRQYGYDDVERYILEMT